MVEPASQLPPSVASIFAEGASGHYLEQELARSRRELTLKRLRVAGALYAGVHLLFFVSLVGFAGGLVVEELARRALIISISLTFSALTYVPRLERHAEALAEALTLLTTGYLLLFVLEWGVSSGTEGLVLLTVCTGLLFPFTAERMLRIALFTTVGYVAAALWVLKPGEASWLFSGIAYVASAAAIAVVGTRLSHALRREELRARLDLGIQRDNADQLLLNILPRPIIERLKKDKSAIAQSFNEATVLFADIVGFTPLSAKMTPSELVGMLNDIFSKFDALTEQHGLEKIKTIGDAYMVAGGIPTPRGDHVEAVARLALAMRDVVDNFVTPTGARLQIRVGIHTGPVAAGVIGTKKFTYDLWGDTVNLAARMESHGEPGTIQVTERVADALRSQFNFEPRGKLSIKGKGELSAFVLQGTHRKITSLYPEA
ncbi:MAG: adenylate/guanylate cyclase domain-containing protein [Polyangiaceae bacterium]